MSDDANRLKEEYHSRFSRIAEYRNEVWRVLCDDFFRSYVSRTATVLDVGCGWGEFINNIDAACKFAMDLNPAAEEKLKKGIGFLRQDCSQEWKLQDESLDVVFSSNFLEHLASKNHVEKTLSEAYRCLRKGGRIVLLGPNIRYVDGAYWDFWDHYVPLTEKSLAEVLRLLKFEIHAVVPRFLPYSMSTGRTPPLFFLKTYLRMPFVWPVFGKQFLVMAEKAK